MEETMQTTTPHPELSRILAERAAQLLDCGHTPTDPRSFHANGVPLTSGYATERDTGRKVCEACAEDRERAAFAASERYGAYLSGDGCSITTWTGAQLARVTYEGTARTGFYDSEITYLRAVSDDGRVWYGKNGGRGMCVTLRLSRTNR